MRAIILAAGRGSRLGNITDEKPKCLTELAGKTLLEWQLEAIKGSQITEIGIVRGYKKEKIQVEDAIYFDNERWNETNMVMSLYAASEWLEKYECIVSYSDIVYKPETIDILKRDSSYMSITYNTNWLELWKARFENPLEDAETFKIDEDGNLIEIGKRANTLDEIEGQYMGLLKFNPKGWDYVKKVLKSLPKEKQDKLDMTTLLNILLKSGVKINAIPTSGLWLEVDDEQDLNLYKSWNESGVLQLV